MMILVSKDTYNASQCLGSNIARVSGSNSSNWKLQVNMNGDDLLHYFQSIMR